MITKDGNVNTTKPTGIKKSRASRNLTGNAVDGDRQKRHRWNQITAKFQCEHQHALNNLKELGTTSLKCLEVEIFLYSLKKDLSYIEFMVLRTCSEKD
jgi:hypothetical protein